MSNREYTGEIRTPSRSLGELRRSLESALVSARWLALVYLLALVLAETVITLVEPLAGMVLHGLTLLALLVHAAMIGRGAQPRLLLALALAPLIRLVSLTMPLPDFPFIYWYIVVGTPLLIAAIVVARLGRLNRGMLGLKWRALPWQLAIALTGIGIGLVEYLILRPQPMVGAFSWRQILLPALILLLFTGFLEEFIFRGVMQYSSLRNLGRLGIFYVAAIFAVLHFGYRSLLDVVFVFGVAVFFGYVTLRTGSILGVSLSHGLTNIFLFLVFPFLLVSKVPQVAPSLEVEAPQQSESPGVFVPTPEIVGPALWAPPPQNMPTATALPVEATNTPTSTPTPSLTPTSTPTATITEQRDCQPPRGWVRYNLRADDTLSSIAQEYDISTTLLRTANCIETGQGIGSVGDIIYVPNAQPTATPKPSKTPKPPTATPKVNNPTAVPTRTAVPPSATPTSQPASPTPTQAPPTPTDSNLPPPTEAPTVVPPSNTPVPPSATPVTPEPTNAPETTAEPPGN